MARVIDTSGLQSVLPESRPPSDYLNIQATPEAFGSQIGQALQHAGAQQQQDANELAQAAVQKQQYYNQIASDDAFNKLQKGYLDLTYGDPNDPTKKGFYATRGSDAMSAYQPTIKSMGDLRQQITEGLPNDRVRLEFDQAARRLEMFTREAMGRHYDQQLNVYGIATQKAGIDNAVQGAALNYNDDSAFQNNLVEAQRSAVRMSQSAGAPEGSPIYQQNMQEATSRVIAGRAQAMGDVNPKAALDLVQTYRQMMTQKDYEALETHLRTRASAATGAQMNQEWSTGAAPSGAKQIGPAPNAKFDNNLGNLRVGPTSQTDPWQGSGVPTNTGFETFATPEQGVRAATINYRTQLAKIQASGQDPSFINLLNVVGPASDNNNPQWYAGEIAKTVGLGPNDNVPIDDKPKMATIMQRVAQIEKGAWNVPSDKAVYEKGVDMAFAAPRTQRNVGEVLPQGGGAALAAYTTGNAAPGAPSSVENVNPEFAGRIAAMVSQMPPEIQSKFQIISGFRDQNRQAEVNPAVTNSHHTMGMAVDTNTDPDVLAWINQHGADFGVGFPLKDDPKEANHLEPLENGQRVPPEQMAQWVAQHGGGADQVIGGSARVGAPAQLVSVTNAAGLLQPGNIDLNRRPVVKNAEGTISTVRSMGINEDGKEVLIPTVAADGSRILSDQEAIDQYHQTGQFLGKFDTPEHATAYAQQLHQAQAQQYAQVATTPPPAPAPGIAQLSQAEAELAQNFALKMSRANDDPRRLTDIEGWKQGVQQAELYFRTHQMAITAQKQAITEQRNVSVADYARGFLKNPGDSDLYAKMINDQNLDEPSLRALDAIVREHQKATADGDVQKYGQKFYDVFRLVHPTDPNDPNRIHDPSQLYQMAVPKADGSQDLTLAGVEKLAAELKGNSHPENVAEGEIRKGALAYARQQITGMGDPNADEAAKLAGIYSPDRLNKFNIGFVPAFYKYWDAGIQSGKTPQELVNKSELDKLIEPFMKSEADNLKATAQPNLAAPKIDLTNKDGILSAYQDGYITRDDARKRLNDLGFPNKEPEPQPPVVH